MYFLKQIVRRFGIVSQYNGISTVDILDCRAIVHFIADKDKRLLAAKGFASMIKS